MVDETAKKIPVIAYIGFADTKQSVEMAQYAQSVGADGVSAVPPYYYGYDFEAILGYYKAIAESVTIPVVVYYIPSQGAMSTESLQKLLSLPNVCGLKFTGPDHYAMQMAKKAAGDKLIFSGRDEQCLSGLIMGGDGLIGSSYNLTPELALGVVDAYMRGDLRSAEKISYAANQVLAELTKYPYLSAVKTLLGLVGIHAPTVRGPMQSITEKQFAALTASLQALKSVPELQASEIIRKI